MDLRRIYEDETGKSAYSVYHHVAGPSEEYVNWLTDILMAIINNFCTDSFVEDWNSPEDEV